MSDDPIPTSAPRQPRSEDGSQNPTPENSLEAPGHDERGRRSRPQSRDGRASAKSGLTKKLEFVTDLMISLDMLIYVELCTLYYMDCSLPRLLLRTLAQSFFLTPKSDDFLVLLPAHRPHVFAVFMPNVVCMLLHIFSSLPAASEASRGYLHGGVIIDFVGQKAPTSRSGLLLLDVVILALQCFMLAVHSEREKLRDTIHPLRRTRGTTAAEEGASTSATTAAPRLGQDHDAEERGVSRHGVDATGRASDDIELQPLSSRGRMTSEEDGGESSQLLVENSAQGAAAPDLSDVMSSGTAVLAEFHVIHAIRTASNDYQSAAAHSLQTIGYAATLARLAAERRAQIEGRQQP